MVILEHGQAQALLFFPCTAEPVWAFAETIALLSKTWHVLQVVFDGHQPEYPGDFTSVEQAVDEVVKYLKNREISRLDAAYGCSLGGACLPRFLALGKILVDRAAIDGGITPYQLPYLVRRLILARDVLAFKLVAGSRKILEAPFHRSASPFPDTIPSRSTTRWNAILKLIPNGPSAASSGRATIMPFRISLPRAARSLPIGTARKRRKTGRITSAF